MSPSVQGIPIIGFIALHSNPQLHVGTCCQSSNPFQTQPEVATEIPKSCLVVLPPHPKIEGAIYPTQDDCPSATGKLHVAVNYKISIPSVRIDHVKTCTGSTFSYFVQFIIDLLAISARDRYKSQGW